MLMLIAHACAAQVLQIVQLLKARREQRRIEELRMISDDNGGDYDPVAEENQPSRVGQKLSDLTTSRVVLLVLAMLFVLPVFNIGSGIYGTAPSLGSAGIKVGYVLYDSMPECCVPKNFADRRQQDACCYVAHCVACSMAVLRIWTCRCCTSYGFRRGTPRQPF